MFCHVKAAHFHRDYRNEPYFQRLIEYFTVYSFSYLRTLRKNSNFKKFLEFNDKLIK